MKRIQMERIEMEQAHSEGLQQSVQDDDGHAARQMRGGDVRAREKYRLPAT